MQMLDRQTHRIAAASPAETILILLFLALDRDSDLAYTHISLRRTFPNRKEEGSDGKPDLIRGTHSSDVLLTRF
jgi:hypothetical protein